MPGLQDQPVRCLHSGKCVATSPVVAYPGLVLASSAPVGPGPDAPRVGRVPLHQADQQPADLGQGVADHARISGTDPFFTAWALAAESQARASMDKVMWAYQARQVHLVVVEPGFVFRGGHTLRGFDRLPGEVELTNPRHPLAGQRVPVMSAYRRCGGVWLVVMLPDGFPAAVRVDETDLGGRGVAVPGTTILSVAGIRRLRGLAAAMAAKGRDR